MHYDLIIVGGGLVGKSVAAALRHSSLKIALIDASKEERPDPRLIALNYGSYCFLNKIGVWSAIEEHSAAIREVHVSQRGQFGTTRMNAEQIKLEALGYVVPAAAINQAFADALKTSQGFLDELRPVTVTGIELHKEQATLWLDDQNQARQVTASLIIAADGTHSSIRKLLNFETKTVDYQQSALVTTTTLERSHQHRAYERFLEDGALAMLPLKDKANGESQCATIWTAPTHSITSLMHLSDFDFTQRLQEQFGYRLGRLKNISTRHVYPLHFFQVINPVKERLVLVGNAAHTIHPIAAQGLNLALYEISHLTQLLLTNAQQKQPLLENMPNHLIGGPQKTNLLFSHYLAPLFSSDFWGSKLVRGLGMVGLDLCPPLKSRLSRILAMESVKWI